MVLIAVIGALALATVPIVIGWRRSFSDASLVRALELSPTQKRMTFDDWVKQTGTGLSTSQVVIGLVVWTVGGFLLGLMISPISGLFGAFVGFVFYRTGLNEKRQDFRMAQSRDILRALGLMETMLSQGRSLNDTLEEAARSVGQAGQLVISDLVNEIRATPIDEMPAAIRRWTQRWRSPGSDIMGTALIAAIEGRIEIAPLISAMRVTLSDVMDILSRTRAEATGTTWQVRFLAIVPVASIWFTNLIAPEFGRVWAQNPIFLVPVFAGSVVSYLLSMRMINNGLSLEASVGLTQGKVGEIPVDRMGRLL